MRPSIVYLHGFRSSPRSVKARALAAAIKALPAPRRPRYLVPALDHRPDVAVRSVAELIEREIGVDARDSLTLVGSSLGGFYATHLAERFASRAVLINPAIHPDDDLRPYEGEQTNLYSGESFVVTPAHFDALAALRVQRIGRPERYLLLVQAGDEVLDHREAIAFYAGAWQSVEGGGDHGFQRFEAQIPAILRFAGVRDGPV